MFIAYLLLLVTPFLFIVVWSMMTRSLQLRNMAVYKATSFIGTPVHELAHALVCIVFGMRIVGAKFFALPGGMKNRQLGYVNFTYNPNSPIHLLGRLIQGIAPLIAGGAVTVYFLGLWNHMTIPYDSAASIQEWMQSIPSITLTLAYNKALVGPMSAAMVVLVAIVALHCVPSMSDIRIGTKAFVVSLLMIWLFTVGIDVIAKKSQHLPFAQKFIGSGAYWVAKISVWIRVGLFMVLYGAIASMTLALASLIILVLIPQVFVMLYRTITPQRQLPNSTTQYVSTLATDEDQQAVEKVGNISHAKSSNDSQEATNPEPTVAIQPEINQSK